MFCPGAARVGSPKPKATPTDADDAPAEWNQARKWNQARASFAFLLFAFTTELLVLLSTPSEGLADLVKGTDPLLDEILARVPAIKRGRVRRCSRSCSQNLLHQLDGIPYQRVEVDVTDCADNWTSGAIPR